MGWLSAIDLYRFVSCKEVTKSPIFGAFLQAKLQTVAITAYHKYHVFVLSVLSPTKHETLASAGVFCWERLQPLI